MSGETALIPCVICNDSLPNPYGCANQPDGGLEFITGGHYGSTVFDPMDGTTLAINICDVCVNSLRHLRHIGIYRNNKFKRWGAPRLAASADTLPEGGDAKQAPCKGSAVGNAETPKPSRKEGP